MQTTQGNMLESLRTVKAFLEENAAKLTDVVNTGARQRLDDAIAELSGHASDQTGSALASHVPRSSSARRARRCSATTWHPSHASRDLISRRRPRSNHSVTAPMNVSRS
jgi:hypothetical protein